MKAKKEIKPEVKPGKKKFGDEDDDSDKSDFFDGDDGKDDGIDRDDFGGGYGNYE